MGLILRDTMGGGNGRSRGRAHCGSVAVAPARFVRLYEVTASDPFSYLASLVVLMVVAAIAGLVPARRATRIDPVMAMRAE